MSSFLAFFGFVFGPSIALTLALALFGAPEPVVTAGFLAGFAVPAVGGVLALVKAR